MRAQTRIGLYLTIIVHLVALIVVLLCGIHHVRRPQSAFVIDFSKQEALEQLEQLQEELKEKEALRASLAKELEEALSGRGELSRASIRNVAVNRNQPLKDDRFQNPNQVYDEARELQRKLEASRKAAMAETGDEPLDPAPGQKGQDNTASQAYNGPSVLEYVLDGRKATSLPIPVYKCMGGGDVTVLIQVDRRGYVVEAAVAHALSSQDHCLREYAVKAAKRSRFTASHQAPPKQSGSIVYRFIAQ